MEANQIRRNLSEIFAAALERVSPYSMIRNHVRLKDNTLLVESDRRQIVVDLNHFHRILLLGAGKASAPMARALEEILGTRINDGLVCVKYGHAEPLAHADIVEAGHPVPDDSGVQAARRMSGLAAAADAETLVINCISGGGSALLPSPLDSHSSGGLVELTLDDKQCITGALLGCGAGIREINCVRKHLSGLKGGRLAALLHPARSLNFILSDVIGDDLSSIASGMTSPDPTTFTDALGVIERYGLRGKIPAPVIRALEFGQQGRLVETPKPGDPFFAKVDNVVVGSNRLALQAAAARARSLGFPVQMLEAPLCGEARDEARMLAGLARQAALAVESAQRPLCLLAGGETVVTLRGTGKGGRNQELALAFLEQMAGWGEEKERVSFLSAATDGNDGPTDAAGAFADAEALRWAGERGLSIGACLADNDAYHFFEATGALLKTGPTNTNVCDMQIALIV